MCIIIMTLHAIYNIIITIAAMYNIEYYINDVIHLITSCSTIILENHGLYHHVHRLLLIILY